MASIPRTDVEAWRARRERVVQASRRGESAASIAEREGITKRSVTRIRREVGIAQPVVAPALTPEKVAAAEAFLADGCSYAEVARTIGCGVNALKRRFPGQGWTRAESASFMQAQRWAGYHDRRGVRTVAG